MIQIQVLLSAQPAANDGVHLTVGMQGLYSGDATTTEQQIAEGVMVALQKILESLTFVAEGATIDITRLDP